MTYDIAQKAAKDIVSSIYRHEYKNMKCVIGQKLFSEKAYVCKRLRLYSVRQQERYMCMSPQTTMKFRGSKLRMPFYWINRVLSRISPKSHL
jgi:hypothetical protein